MIDRLTVHEVAWVHSHGSLFHESVLPILSVHGKRLPHHEGGTDNLSVQDVEEKKHSQSFKPKWRHYP